MGDPRACSAPVPGTGGSPCPAGTGVPGPASSSSVACRARHLSAPPPASIWPPCNERHRSLRAAAAARPSARHRLGSSRSRRGGPAAANPHLDGPWRSRATDHARWRRRHDRWRGRSAALCRSARPRTPPGIRRGRRSSFQWAVELRLGEIGRRFLQDLVGLPQLADLALELLDPARSSLVTPSRAPLSVCTTQRRKDSRLHPIFGAMARIAAARSG